MVNGYQWLLAEYAITMTISITISIIITNNGHATTEKTSLRKSYSMPSWMQSTNGA